MTPAEREAQIRKEHGGVWRSGEPLCDKCDLLALLDAARAELASARGERDEARRQATGWEKSATSYHNMAVAFRGERDRARTDLANSARYIFEANERLLAECDSAHAAGVAEGRREALALLSRIEAWSVRTPGGCEFHCAGGLFSADERIEGHGPGCLGTEIRAAIRATPPSPPPAP